jgi:hypothetical protein
MSLIRAFIDEVKEQVNETWRLQDAPAWITKFTYLNDERYSFKDHEFQEVILRDPARIVNTQKCSQIGLSEATARWGVAVANMIPNFKVITTFPFSGDAEDFAKTRIDPFIASSPKLREAINPKLNNSSIKQFNGSLMYFRGTNGKTAAISIPADCIISDEIDRSDPHVLTQYQSRLTHSKWQLRRNFSTPTVPGHGIAKEMESSMRFKNLCKCNHCARWFLPDYFEHVKIPDYDGNLRAITKSNLSRLRWREAKLHCPHCGAVPDLGPKWREYVCENKDDKHEAHGYYVSPFDAPFVLGANGLGMVPFLIQTSTNYARYSEFVNQNLGLAEEDSSEALTLAAINKALLLPGVDLYSTNIHAMGIDMGLTCYIVISRMDIEGNWLIVHRERCVISKLQERKLELQKLWRVAITVMDSQPFTDTVIQFQRADQNCFGAVYSNSKKLETFTVKMFEGDEEEGKLPIHTVQINRDRMFDVMLGYFQRDAVTIAPMGAEEDELFTKHCLDMRRVQVFDEHQELTWQWVKSSTGQDHYHHAANYSLIAAQLRGTISRNIPFGGLPILRGFSTVRQGPSVVRSPTFNGR